MAQPPTATDTFLREVDENLRRDRLTGFAKRYGSWVIAGVVLFLALSGGYIYWQQRQVQKSEQQVERLSTIYKGIGSGDLKKSAAELDPVIKESKGSVKASALFTKAALALEQNDVKLATATFRDVAADESLPKPYRDLALIRQTSLEFDSLKPEQVISRMQPLAKPGNPWFGSAGELTGAALLKQGKKQEAARLFATLARDRNVPETLRDRAVQIASSLGVDESSILLAPAQ